MNVSKEKKIKTRISGFRKLYIGKFVLRCLLLLVYSVCYFVDDTCFKTMSGMKFFKGISLLHLMWVVWVFDMIMQIIPVKGFTPLGSQKFLKKFYMPIKEIFSREKLEIFIKRSTIDSLKVLVLWIAIIFGLGILYFAGLLSQNDLFMISMIFYVCDIICVLFWCPFRALFMKNRCCATCTIFNWDHLMMLTPLIFIPGFYTWSLVFLSIVVFLIWEVCFYLFPERFWDGSNEALRCSNCEERLCGRNAMPH